MPLRGHGLTTKASRSRARSSPPEEEELTLSVQRLRDKLRETQPFYLEEDVVVIPFPSSESGSTSPTNGSTSASFADVPPFILDDPVSPPGSPTRSAPTNGRGHPTSTGASSHFTTTATTINLDVPLSPTLFVTAVNLLDTKAIARSRRVAMDALKLIGQGYSLVWQDSEFIVDAARQPPTPMVSFLGEDTAMGRRSTSPAMGGVRAAMRGPAETERTTTRKSVSPVPTHRPPPHLVKMLDECMQSLLVYANKSHTLSQFITAHQPTLHLFCFIGSAARAVEEGGEGGDEVELFTDRHHTTPSSSESLETVALPQRDVELELRELNLLWETCGLGGTRLADHLRECYLTEFLLDAALPPAVCSARYDGIMAALAEKKKRLMAELASGRSPLSHMMGVLPLRSVMGLLTMSASADPKSRAKLLDKLATEGLLDVVLHHIRSAIAEWMHWASPSTSPSSLGSSAAVSSPPAEQPRKSRDSKPQTPATRSPGGGRAPSTSPRKRGRTGSPPATSNANDQDNRSSHWSDRRARLQSAASSTATTTPTLGSQVPGCSPHLQYLPLSPGAATGEGTATKATSSSPSRGSQKSRKSRETAEAPPRARYDPPIVRLGFCVEVLLLLTSPNLRHPQEADELARNPKTASSAVVRSTAWSEETDAVEALVAYLLWIIAASSTAFEEEVSLELFDVPTSLLASLQEQAMDCVLQLATYSSAMYGVVVQTLEKLLSNRLVLTIGDDTAAASTVPPARPSKGGRRSVSPARRQPQARTSTSSPSASKPSCRDGAARQLSQLLSSASATPTPAPTTVHVRLTGAGGLLPLLVSLLCRAEEAQKHTRSVRQWFTWLTAHLVPSAFEFPTLTNGRRSTLAWGTATAAKHGTATRSPSPGRRRGARSASPTPPPRGHEAPVLARDLRRDEVASLLPYFRFGTRVVLETGWRDGAEAFFARLATLAYHVVLGRRNNLSFGLASVCYDVVAPLLETVTGLMPGQVVPQAEIDALQDTDDGTPGADRQGWLRDDFVLVSTPSRTPSEFGAEGDRQLGSTSPSSTRKKRTGRSVSPRRGASRAKPRESVQTFIPSPSRSPIFFEAYSPSSSDSPSLRKRSPPRSPSKSASAKKRARSPSSESHTPTADEAPSPPPATAASPLATTRSTWRDRLSLRMFLSSLSLTGGSSTPQRASGEV